MTDMSHPDPTLDYTSHMTRAEARANHRDNILKAADDTINAARGLVEAHMAAVDDLKLTDNAEPTAALEQLHIAISNTLDAMESQLNEDLRLEQSQNQKEGV